ncbi:MAG: flagellar motor protein MotB [Runella slithyformis]|nr:MAG: flagellar motor protein MotB [Runella slithyformis]TAE99280.1 MAG: flagellar motor protein MotB [Runella slithyformis]TAF29065.1 MAG: flagellar motor protein MotB [Runella slithyformis]TAF48742.1 MAG: flagellar motor protein MotB [Runella slithyformis]TAF79799.1 MAG: flagellar motor protein MotB [Runella slithyformis]
MSKHNLFSGIIFVAMAGFLVACNSTQALYKQGVRKFENGEYDLAIKDLRTVADANYEPARANYLLGESFRLSNRPELSATYYQKALEKGETTPEVPFYYGFALKAAGKYQEAITELNKYVTSNPANKVFLEKANRELYTLKSIAVIEQKKTFYKVTNLGKLNTEGAEFSPFVQNEDLIFAASRKVTVYKNNGMPMTGIYKVKLAENYEETGGTAEIFSSALFLEEVNEANVAFAKDGKTVVFARGNTGKRKGSADVDLYLSRFSGGSWSDPRMIPVSDSAAWDGSPAFSRDGRTLYFSSNRPGGVGGIDIYRTNMDASGRFSKPVNMGKDINTPGDEMFPYVAPDAKLYFSSDGHPGLGKLDVFVATRSQGVITIENLGTPINTRFDDFGLVFADDEKRFGFLSSNRTGGKGDDDIYLVEDESVGLDSTQLAELEKLPPNDPRRRAIVKPEPPKVVNYFLAGLVSSTDTPTLPLDSAIVKLLEANNDSLLAEGVAKEGGIFGTFPLQEGKDYTILVEKTGYLTKREPFSMAGRAIPPVFRTKLTMDTTFKVGIKLDRLATNLTFVLENIYYDLNKYNIRPDAAVELDKLVQILKDNPSVKIELSSHTDSRSPDAYNNTLSQNRARSAVEYVITKGIVADRLTAKGYGETRLIIKDAKTEEEHQKNRRTEFTILSY